MPDEPSVRIRELDVIEIPSRQASNRELIAETIRDPDPWPGRAFDVYMEYNTVAERWTWYVKDRDEEFMIDRQPALYGNEYWYKDLLLFMFADLSGSTHEITPNNLGDTVELLVIPGPDNPAAEEWLERQDVNEDADG